MIRIPRGGMVQTLTKWDVVLCLVPIGLFLSIVSLV
jgi:hypothetical protein